MGLNLSTREREETVRRIVRVFKDEWIEWKKEFDDYDDGYDFLAGDQYTRKQKKYFEVRRRPTNVFNIIFPIFNRIMGELLLTQVRERVYSYSGGDSRVAQIFENLIDRIGIDSEYKDEMATTLLAGMIKRGHCSAMKSKSTDPL